MPQNAIRRQTLWLGITATVLALALMTLLAGAGLLARQMEHLERQAERERLLDARAGQLNEVLTALSDAETGQRGYLLTGKARYLRPYTEATGRLEHLLQGLDGPLPGDTQDAARVSQVRFWARGKLHELAETLRLHDAGRQADALALVQTDVGEGAMERLRSELGVLERSMRAEGDRLNTQEEEDLEHTRQLSVLVITLLVVFVVVFGLQVALLLRSRAIYERRLARDGAFLAEVGRVAGVGGWEFDVRTDEALWSEQVRTILGVEPTSAPSVEATFGFFAPEARETIRGAVFAARYEGTAFDLELPVVTPAGASRIVRIIGEAENDAAGMPSRVVGALQDITARKQVEEGLRDLTQIVESTSDFVVTMNWEGSVTYLNPAARRRWHYALDGPLPVLPLAQLLTEETNAQFAHEIQPAVERWGVWTGDASVIVDGQPLPVNAVVTGHRDALGRVARYSGVLRDIAALVRARKDLLRQTATLDTIVEAIPAVVVVLDTHLRYRMVNRAFERWRGIDRAQALGRTVAQVLGQPEFERSAASLQRALAGETVTYEKDFPDTPSRYMSVTYIPMRLEDGRVEGLIAVAQDVTRMREEQLRLMDLSERDPLTGIYNRAGFAKCLGQHVAKGGARSLALLFIDLDHFKPINDARGHAVGDELLLQFAHRLQLLVRGGDAVARLGGDEFAIALVGVADIAGARAVAAKVVEAASTPFDVRDLELRVGASVGVAIDASGEAGLSGLMERADTQLYAAKAAGRGRFA